MNAVSLPFQECVEVGALERALRSALSYLAYHTNVLQAEARDLRELDPDAFSNMQISISKCQGAQDMILEVINLLEDQDTLFWECVETHSDDRFTEPVGT